MSWGAGMFALEEENRYLRSRVREIHKETINEVYAWLEKQEGALVLLKKETIDELKKQ